MWRLRSFWLWAGAVWLVLLAGGWHMLLRHDLTPGADGGVPEHWPMASALPHDTEQPVLILFAHRNCPCTRASLRELEYVLANAPRCARVLIVLFSPAESELDGVGSSIEEQSRSLPGAEVIIDRHGVEARRFQVRTSGHVLLYGPGGGLLFSGGITGSRAHEGENDGQRSLLTWMQGKEGGQRIAPVFGCSLFSDDETNVEIPSWNQ